MISLQRRQWMDGNEIFSLTKTRYPIGTQVIRNQFICYKFHIYLFINQELRTEVWLLPDPG